jgi:hypothetical protein
VGRKILKLETSLLHRTRESQMPNESTRSLDPKKSAILISFLLFLKLLAEDSVFVLEPFARFVVPFHRNFNVGLLILELSCGSSV